MTADELKRAKELFNDKNHDLNILSNDNEWIKINIPYETVIEWVIEYVNDCFDEIDDLINENLKKQNRDDIVHKVVLVISILLKKIDDYNLDNYYSKIVSLLIKINYDEYLLYSQLYSFDGFAYYLVKFILRDKENKNIEFEYNERQNYDSHKYEYDTNERFIGLLPTLFISDKLDLFDRLFDLCCDLISNLGSFWLMRDLYNYSHYIDDKKLINKVIESIKKYKNNYYLYRQLDDAERIEDIHIDKEKELEWLRRNFYLLLNDNREKAYSSEIINSYLDYYKIDKAILNKWESSILDYYENILNNADKYLELDTSFVDMNKHSKYYVDYLRNKIDMKWYIVTIIIYCMTKSKEDDKIIDLINNVINQLLEVKYYGFAFYIGNEFLLKILNSDMSEGYLIKYYNEDKNIYELYKKLIISLFDYCIKHSYQNKKYTIQFSKTINQFARIYHDTELLEASDKVIDKEINEVKNNARNYVVEEIKKSNCVLDYSNNVTDEEKRHKMCWHIDVSNNNIISYISEFRFDELLSDFVSLIKKANFSEFIVYSKSFKSREDNKENYCYLDYLLNDINNTKYHYSIRDFDDFNRLRYFSLDGDKFFGLIPYLYRNNKKNLFDDIIDMICDLITNFGNECHTIILNLYNYAHYINDQNLINKVIDSIKNYKNNYYLYRGLDEIENIKDIHIDKEKELEWLRRNFCLLLNDNKEEAYSNETINSYLDYYNIDKSILYEWESNIIDYYENILNNSDKYLELDTSFVDMSKHSTYYVEFLNKYSKNERLLLKIFNNYISITNDIKIDTVNEFINVFLNKIFINNTFNRVGFNLDINNKFLYMIINKECKSGLLIDYYNNGYELYNTYKKFSIELLKLFVSKEICMLTKEDKPIKIEVIEFMKRLFNFFYEIRDNESIEKLKLINNKIESYNSVITREMNQ